ncbi:MAG: YdcH family protein [Pseudomonadota bacterium]
MNDKAVSRDQLVAELLDANTEFRALFKEHQELEAQIEEFGRRRFLTTDESMERKRLQKVKLQGKDRMEEILRCRGTQTASAA